MMPESVLESWSTADNGSGATMRGAARPRGRAESVSVLVSAALHNEAVRRFHREAVRLYAFGMDGVLARRKRLKHHPISVRHSRLVDACRNWKAKELA
jgi:hypothetical protein